MKKQSRDKSNIKIIPAGQALGYTIKRALEAINWLEELQNQWQKKYDLKEKDCPKVGFRRRIIVDVIAMYVTTLVDSRKGTHSLVNSYETNDVIKKIVKLPIIKKSKISRNNRGAHESRSYGGFVYTKDILNSDLKPLLKELQMRI